MMIAAEAVTAARQQARDGGAAEDLKGSSTAIPRRDRAKHDRVLGAAVRLVDLGFFRPGGEEYAEENGTFGLAAIRKDPPA
jgi:DNA topoisomerase IB